MDNVYILCHDEKELKRILEIGSMFGFLPDYYEDVDECIENELGVYNFIKTKGKVVVKFHANFDMSSSSMFVTLIDTVLDIHSLRSLRWLEILLEDYTV